MTFYAYIIKSVHSGRYYYGHTSDLDERIRSHNSSQNKYTRGKGPWVLAGSIQYSSKGEAMKIEHMLKKMKHPSRALNWIQRNGAILR